MADRIMEKQKYDRKIKLNIAPLAQLVSRLYVGINQRVLRFDSKHRMCGEHTEC